MGCPVEQDPEAEVASAEGGEEGGEREAEGGGGEDDDDDDEGETKQELSSSICTAECGSLSDG